MRTWVPLLLLIVILGSACAVPSTQPATPQPVQQTHMGEVQTTTGTNEVPDPSPSQVPPDMPQPSTLGGGAGTTGGGTSG